MSSEVTTSEKNAIKIPSAKDDYLSKMEAQGKEWDAQLALWGAKAETASAEVKADFHRWQREFKGRRGHAQKTLETLRSAKHEAWEDLKTGVESAWSDVKTAVESAKKRFE